MIKRSGNINYIDTDSLIADALSRIYTTYGDIVSVKNKGKSLVKWGENDNIGTSRATVMTLPTGIVGETLLSANSITSVSSSSGSDTQDIILVEGHTISGTNLTFNSDVAGVTLTGQTTATLNNAIARATMARLESSAVGDIYFHEGGAVTGGVPNDLTTVHMMIPAGEIQTQKASTAISSIDYWLLTSLSFGILEKTGSYAKCRVEIKPTDGSVDWYPIMAWLSVTDSSGEIIKYLKPYKIIPPNHDVRVSAIANTSSVHVIAGMDGFLAN